MSTKQWTYNSEFDLWEQRANDIYMMVYKHYQNDAWCWRVYQIIPRGDHNWYTSIIDSETEYEIARARNPRTRRKAWYTSRRGAQRACEAWVDGMLEREREEQ